jgi:hypothetical protein
LNKFNAEILSLAKTPNLEASGASAQWEKMEQSVAAESQVSISNIIVIETF